MRKSSAIILLAASLLLAACSLGPQPTGTASESPPQGTGALAIATSAPLKVEPTNTPPQVVAETTSRPQDSVQVPPFEGEGLYAARGRYFNGSGTCAICHTNMADSSGKDVSIDSFWRSTMMANAAIDPYWQAAVQKEVLVNPDLVGVIEGKCAKCHTPMAQFTMAAQGEESFLSGDGLLNASNELHGLAIDGVSCTLCHQIDSGNFGDAESFSGGYMIDVQLPAGERFSYGPFEPPPGLARMMQSGSGFTPVRSEHIRQSEICGTCHTLYTPSVSRSGEFSGVFPEQMTYQEWLYSDYSGMSTCQSCHMPHAEGSVQLSITGGPMRSPFSQHAFAGGNSFVLSLLRAFGPEMGVTASSEQLETSIAWSRGQIETETAFITLQQARVDSGVLEAEVQVESLVGHKFPTGFPSRRAWVHFVVQDADGEIIFDSGSYASDGSIIENDNDLDAESYEPHYDLISDPSQVQIYESLMLDSEGQVTTVLLYGAGYAKDNRLLPVGFDIQKAGDDVAVRGAAAQDGSFSAGGDSIRYQVVLGDAQGPFTLSVELLYQSVGYRWANSFQGLDAPGIERFETFSQQVSNLPLAVSSDSRLVE